MGERWVDPRNFVHGKCHAANFYRAPASSECIQFDNVDMRGNRIERVVVQTLCHEYKFSVHQLSLSLRSVYWTVTTTFVILSIDSLFGRNECSGINREICLGAPPFRPPRREFVRFEVLTISQRKCTVGIILSSVNLYQTTHFTTD